MPIHGKWRWCSGKQKRGKRAGVQAKLKTSASRPAVPSLFLSSVCVKDNKMDLLRLRLRRKGNEGLLVNCADRDLA